jgi:hypothetical protein
MRTIRLSFVIILIFTASVIADGFTWTDIDLEKRSEQASALTAVQHDNNMTKTETLNSIGTAVEVLNRFGEMFQVDNTNAITINTINVWEQVENFSAGHLGGVTFADNGLVVGAGDHELTATVSFSGGTNTTIQFAFAVDGTVDTDHIVERRLSNSDVGVCPIVGIIQATAGQTVTIYVRNITSNVDVTVKHSTVRIKQIHNN